MALMMVDQRVAALEAHAKEQATMTIDLRDTLRQMEQRIDARFQGVDQRFAAMEMRFVNVEQSLTGIRDAMATDFRWLVGLQITTVLTVVAALAAALLSR